MRRIAAATSIPCEQPPARPCGRDRLPPRRPDLSPSPRGPLILRSSAANWSARCLPSLPPSLRTPRRPAAARRCAHLRARCHPRPPCADDAALRTTRLAARRRSAAGAPADANSARRARRTARRSGGRNPVSFAPSHRPQSSGNQGHSARRAGKLSPCSGGGVEWRSPGRWKQRRTRAMGSSIRVVRGSPRIRRRMSGGCG